MSSVQQNWRKWQNRFFLEARGVSPSPPSTKIESKEYKQPKEI
jgi:hypothetical protein